MLQPQPNSCVWMCAELLATIFGTPAAPRCRTSVPTDLRSAAMAPSSFSDPGNTTMQKMIRWFAPGLLLAIVTISAPALADDKKPADKGASPGAAKVTIYDFSGDTIEGDLIRPEGTTVDARDFAKHSSLIRIRTNFIPEIIKSAEDL